MKGLSIRFAALSLCSAIALMAYLRFTFVGSDALFLSIGWLYLILVSILSILTFRMGMNKKPATMVNVMMGIIAGKFMLGLFAIGGLVYGIETSTKWTPLIFMAVYFAFTFWLTIELAKMSKHHSSSSEETKG